MLDALTAAGWRRESETAELRSVLLDLVDPTDPCDRLDHHGHCQTHGWLMTDPPCPHGRAIALLTAGGTDAH